MRWSDSRGTRSSGVFGVPGATAVVGAAGAGGDGAGGVVGAGGCGGTGVGAAIGGTVGFGVVEVVFEIGVAVVA